MLLYWILSSIGLLIGILFLFFVKGKDLVSQRWIRIAGSLIILASLILMLGMGRGYLFDRYVRTAIIQRPTLAPIQSQDACILGQKCAPLFSKKGVSK